VREGAKVVFGDILDAASGYRSAVLAAGGHCLRCALSGLG
jgi:hypothetical protein